MSFSIDGFASDPCLVLEVWLLQLCDELCAFYWLNFVNLKSPLFQYLFILMRFGLSVVR